ncbi:hypothetical protein BGZ91_003034 [Linnemannia elongata]|nr:hypothetical protein BGZ91_003034 [Linnemannia elongata]
MTGQKQPNFGPTLVHSLMESELASLSSTNGKVHGSLARAGKVKSQTPKVAKQEKKKKLTGRAKKRDTYKRRFVNVTNAPGGKRRMNVNPESTKG